MKKMTALLLLIMLLVSGITFVPTVQAESKFEDVNSSHWAYEEIKFLSDKGIINGFPDGMFKPNASITRTQAVFMLLRDKGITDFTNVVDAGFVDVTSKTYGINEISKAVELGFINGKFNANKDKVFDPNGVLTRSEMGKILAIAYDLTGQSGQEFTDVPKAHWAYASIQGLANNNITFGYGNGKFGVNDKITRGQFSVMMARTLDTSFQEVPQTTQTATPTILTPQVGTGKVYPDGWVAPVLKSSWTSDRDTNFKIFEDELGFEKWGNDYNINGLASAIRIDASNSEHEVYIRLMPWKSENNTLPEIYRIPIVAKELLRFYFEKDTDLVWNYIDNDTLPDEFTANGRIVNHTHIGAGHGIVDLDGAILIKVGIK